MVEKKCLFFYLINIVFFANYFRAEYLFAKESFYYTKRILFTPCEVDKSLLSKVGTLKLLNPFLCLNLQLKSQALVTDYTDLDYIDSLYYIHLYSGIYVNPYFSFHGSFWYKKFKFGDNTSAHTIADYKSDSKKEVFLTEYVFWQVGNPVLTNWRILFGQLYSPIGLNFKIDNELLLELVRNQKYWHFTKYGVQCVIDNQKSTRYEFSYGNDSIKLLHAKNSDTQEKLQLMSFRLSYDLSALEGTRIVLSLTNDLNTYTVYSVGLLNSSAHGFNTAIEYIRIQERYLFKGQYQQMIRISYVGKKDKYAGSIMAEYEHDKDNYHLFLLGYDKTIFKKGSINIIPLYKYELYPNRKNIFGILLGIGIGL